MTTMQETEAPPAGGRSRWTALAALGLVMIALGPALMLSVGLIYGLDIGDEIGFFGGVIGVTAIGALVVWFFGWWAKILGILAAAGGVMMMFWTAFGLQQPGSFFDFVPGLLVVPGGIIAIVSSIAAIVAGRRGHYGVKVTGGERTWIRSVITLVLLGMLISGGLTFIGRESVSDPTVAAETVSALNFQFSPREFEVDGGDAILLSNDDPFYHTFTIDDLDISIELTAGDQILVDIPDRPGTYRFYCIPHSSSEPESATEEMESEDGFGDMSGEMTVN